MFEERSQQIGRVMMLLDMVFTVGLFLLSYWLGSYIYIFPDHHGSLFSHIALLPLLLVFLGVFSPYFGAYRRLRGASVLFYTWAVTRAVVTSIALVMTLLFLLRIEYVSRTVVLIFSLLETVLLIGFRIAMVWYLRNSLRKGQNFLNVLIVGTGPRATLLSKTLRQRAEWGIEIVGHLDTDPGKIGTKVDGFPVVGKVNDITSILKSHVIDEVILAIPRKMIEGMEDIAYACEQEGVRLRMMADMFNLKVARMQLVKLGRIPLLTLEPVAQDEWKLVAKRIMDLIFALVSLAFFLPLMGIAAVAIKLDSPGPIFFTQERVGLKKRRFTMIKFRSMVVGAERRMNEIEHLNEAEGPIFKISNDPRVTRVGKMLRQTSLDELPQLFNVIKGDMSLVGPRPMSIRDVDLFDKGIQRKRFSVKPGLTCIWQISGRSNLPFSKWLEHDLNYIESWSLSLDFKILFKTIPAVLKGSGAV